MCKDHEAFSGKFVIFYFGDMQIKINRIELQESLKHWTLERDRER